METHNDRHGIEGSGGDSFSDKLAVALKNQRAGRLEAAEHLCREILEDEPNHPGALNCLSGLAEAHSNLGTNLLVGGQFGQARGCFEHALRLDPSYAPALKHLISLRGDDSGEETTRKRIETLLENVTLSPADRISLHFTLGDLHDAGGEHDRAFHHYRAGNRLNRERVEYDTGEHEAEVQRLIEVFTAERLKQGLPGCSNSHLPIFIVGMPRSGTTLVEQILSSHPRVHGAGEFSFFDEIQFRDRSGGGPPQRYWECLDALDPQTIAATTAAYLERLRQHASEGERVTDKMLGNYLHLGLIAMAFPRAALIYCRRDPMDTCLSVYFKNFTFAKNFCWDLTEIGHRYRQHSRLMKHWMKALPGRIHEVEYEMLVREQEPTTRRLVEFCRLDWNERCLRFYENTRSVATASLWTVRKPIFTSSIDRWRGYERHLDDLKTALEGDAGRQ